ncbi:flavodoxin domain-containing protein [Cellulomonas dongxiuzhuiae]|uniref:flavodoxin domain-containing protein n=1 Tax=Cellulomonas dongxiuzhuiae TaxID=2819979 RepID=UPI001AAF8513|nr:flavodoxin domain-containing protein [Cellulomonas dongxiuzhuiae]MBO3089066.1 hypothetical protein [Cellulomonas dongxiuzhuiae]
MTAMVVFESMFGGTQAIAEAVAAGIASCGLPVDVVEVGRVVGDGERAPWRATDVLLLAVGGPTHLRGMSTNDSRTQARAHAPTVSGLTGLDRWLSSAPDLVADTPVAAFDTAWGTPDSGSAAHAIAERLQALSGKLVAPPTSFEVAGTTTGPTDAELERAFGWGATLVSARA